MTLFLNFRTRSVAGDVLADPYLLEGDGLADRPALRSLEWLTVPARFAGRHVVFATHGFNVSYVAGVHALAELERALQLDSRFVVVGVLWPGDWWIPVVNYPAEASDAVRCGQRLARFVDDWLAGASAVSFVSHSLGARLVLEAAQGIRRRARQVCVMAAAADDDCLFGPQYAAACRNADRVTVLASRKDVVLKIAYPVGDFVSDVLLRDDDSPWRAALGYHGPRPMQPVAGVVPAQIPDAQGYNHGDYLPPLGAAPGRWSRPAQFVRECLLDVPHPWPA